MTITIIETAGSDQANSYGTLAAANTYFGARLFADAWTNAVDDEQRKAALVTACARLEVEEPTFCGWRVTPSQRLCWPRVSPYSRDDIDWIDTAVASGTVIPREVIESQFELALSMLTLGQDASALDPLAKFSALALPGGTSLHMRDDNSRYQDDLPAVVNRKLYRYRVATTSTKLERA